MVVEWVSARVGGNSQRYCSVIQMWACFDYGITVILRFFYGFFSGYNKNTTQGRIFFFFLGIGFLVGTGMGY